MARKKEQNAQYKSVAEASKILQVSRWTVARHCRSGQMGRRMGKCWFLTDEEIRLLKLRYRKKKFSQQ